MNRLVTLSSRLVRSAPRTVIVVVIVLTAVLAVFSTQLQMATGSDQYAPDNEQIAAAETLEQRFGASGESILQVLVTSDGPGVVSTGGLGAVEAVTAALRDSEVADRLADRPERPGVVSWLLPVEATLGAAGVGGDGLDDAGVRATYEDVLAQLPAEEAELFTSLVADPADPTGSTHGLLLVFLRTDGLTDGGQDLHAALIELDAQVADTIRGASLPAGFDAQPFSPNLILADDGTFDAELARLFASAFLIILAILALVFWVRPTAGTSRLRAGRRTAADALLAMAAIVMAIVWMNGITALLGPANLGLLGDQTEVTSIIAVLLIGLGVDYSIHVNARYRQEVGAGVSVDQAMSRAARTVGVALALATATTAVGFLTNLANPVPTLQDFGVMAAVGIVAAFVLMLTFVPAVRLVLDRRAQRAGQLPRTALRTASEGPLPRLMGRTAILAVRAPVATLLVTVLLGGAVGAWGMSRLTTEFSMTDFVPTDDPILETIDTLQEEFAGGFGETTDVLLSGPIATPAAHNALAEATANLADVPDVTILDGRAAARSSLSLLAQLVLPGPDGRPAAPELAALAAEIGLRPDLTVPADADVARLYDALRATVPEDAAGWLTEPVGGAALARVTVQTTAGEARVPALVAGLEDAFAPLGVAGVSAVVTSGEVISESIISSLRDSQAASLVVTLGAVMLLLVATFWIRDRRPLLGVLTTVPVGLAVLWTFGMMAATGIPFGPVTATIAALAIGIGVPYTIHVANRYQEDRRQHHDADAAIRATVRHTGGALAGSALTTSAGFGILVTSSLIPFRQFGLVTAYAIGFALVGATVVLPSMLMLWDRWHRRRGTSEPDGPVEVRRWVRWQVPTAAPGNGAGPHPPQVDTQPPVDARSPVDARLPVDAGLPVDAAPSPAGDGPGEVA